MITKTNLDTLNIWATVWHLQLRLFNKQVRKSKMLRMKADRIKCLIGSQLEYQENKLLIKMVALHFSVELLEERSKKGYTENVINIILRILLRGIQEVLLKNDDIRQQFEIEILMGCVISILLCMKLGHEHLNFKVSRSIEFIKDYI